nr:transposase [Cylindrospermopsis raciborskii]
MRSSPHSLVKDKYLPFCDLCGLQKPKQFGHHNNKPSSKPHAFKGRSSCLLRRKFPELLKLPSLWTNSYFYSTAGQVSADVIKRYIEDPHHG